VPEFCGLSPLPEVIRVPFTNRAQALWHGRRSGWVAADVARIVSGKLPLDVQTVKLAPVVEAAIDSARPALDAKGLRLSAVLDPEGTLSGDPSRLQQVVWNLLTNATKFTSRGGSIRVVLQRDESHLELVVTDTGQGIEASFLPHVFDRFKQADPSSTRAQGGLGLGLSITKNLVEMHGGTIAVESPGPGRGTTFVVRLPLAAIRQTPGDADLRPRQKLQRPLAQLDVRPELQGLRVLAVDDERDGREVVAAVLASYGALVTTAASVAEAMAVLERDPPDVLLTDIGMPGEDGYSLIAQLRALPRNRGGATPAACLTGYATGEDRRRALLAGFTMHLPKPIDPAELVAVVTSLARMSRALRATTA
jgi:CheY-like chemotaxis protein/anti-sigma regulatory factor (Ser/Thr protein kinase)